MRLDQIRALADSYMSQHALYLAGWRVEFDRAVRRAGACKFGPQVISLSAVLLPTWPDEEVHDTILHEIAHALVGPKHGHDAVWKAKAREIGCKPEREYGDDLPAAPAPWNGTCPNGHTSTRHRRPTRLISCGRCSRTFDPALIITWTFHGRAVTPAEIGRAYASQYARLVPTPAPTPALTPAVAPEPVPEAVAEPLAARTATQRRWAIREDTLF